MSDTQINEDAAWDSAYMNAIEYLFPDAVSHLTGRPLRGLTQDEDDACIAWANAALDDARLDDLEA
jgi:hypothetical protein